MRDSDLQNSKVKRIILYWDYMGKLRIEPDAAVELIRYIFSIKEQWIMKIIRTRRLEEPELEALQLELLELDLNLIENYAKGLIKKGRENRPGQKKLF